MEKQDDEVAVEPPGPHHPQRHQHHPARRASRCSCGWSWCPEADGWALAVLMSPGISDYLDGYLARRLNQTSKLGAILDPVADRLYILADRHRPRRSATSSRGGWRSCCPPRDLFLWCLVPFLRTRGYSALPVHFLGKAATANLLYAFPLLLLGDGDRRARRRWPRCSAGRSRSGAPGCTGGPGCSTPGRSASCSPTTTAGRRRSMAG